jgi:hypothetical protein
MFSDEARKLILDSEGINQPGEWSGGDSGITIGYGDDLGQIGYNAYVRHWQGMLRDNDFLRLKSAIGVKGTKAQAIAINYADIRISAVIALAVFDKFQLPEWIIRVRAFYGTDFDKLPNDCQGALVSLHYNRGFSLIDSHAENMQDREEMRAIKGLVRQFGFLEVNNFSSFNVPVKEAKLDTLDLIAINLECMVRLWPNAHGLVVRRQLEAALVLKSKEEL